MGPVGWHAQRWSGPADAYRGCTEPDPKQCSPSADFRYGRCHRGRGVGDQGSAAALYDACRRQDPLPDSTLVQRTLTPAPWFLFAGSAYLDANEVPQTPRELEKHPSLFVMRTGMAPA